MPFLLDQPPRDASAPYVLLPKLFKPEEARQVISLARQIPVATTTVGDGEGAVRPDTQIRSSEIRWVHWASQVDWIYQRIAKVVELTNQRFFSYHLSGMKEAFQLTRYRASEGGFYDWHTDHDHTPLFSTRKLSVSLLLNDSFEGGAFEFFGTGAVPMGQGDILIFPSYRVHRVTKVTSGVRWSLVSWIAGPHFC